MNSYKSTKHIKFQINFSLNMKGCVYFYKDKESNIFFYLKWHQNKLYSIVYYYDINPNIIKRLLTNLLGRKIKKNTQFKKYVELEWPK